MPRKFQNFVQEDGVLKEQINYYRKLEERQKWDFYDINKICREIALEQGISIEEYKQMIGGNKTSKEPSKPNWKLVTRDTWPKTTANEVGWRHEQGNHNLEIYGRLYRSPKLTMAPLFEPAEVIFLG